MSNIIGIVNYGVAGNIHSVKKAIEKAGGETLVINSASDFKSVDKLVIPGVGSFKSSMKELESDGFIDLIKGFHKPILGICLGMQLLAKIGYEHGRTDGLNLIAEIRLIYDNYGFGTEILAASVRHTMHVIDCAKLGADVMTGPLSSIEGLLRHPLTDSGLAKFLEDYKKGN